MRANTIEDFWDLVEQTDSCWVWYGSINSLGYTKFRLNGENMQAHRLMYELVVGCIPVDLVLDHLCRNRSCVNPSHLEAVTSQENVRRGAVIALRHLFPKPKQQTRCKRGHKLTPSNTTVGVKDRATGRIGRQCRACAIELKRVRRAAEKLKLLKEAK